MRISLAMIARDQEERIGQVLRSAALFCDEMVVIDFGSSDSTRVVAQENGAMVYEGEWTGDFAEARNMSFDVCTGDWIVWLDANDVLPEPSQRAFTASRARLSDDLDAISSPYHWAFAKDGSPLLSRYVPRLIRRAAGLRWEGRIYERMPVAPKRSGFDPLLIVENRPSPGAKSPFVESDISLLADAVASGDQSPETLFHYANELFDDGDFEAASLMYKQFLAADEQSANRYWAMVFLAECNAATGTHSAAEEVALSALTEDSSRAEALMLLGRMRFDREEWHEAIPFFVAATAARRPPAGFVRVPDYLYAPWDYLSVCYEKVGKPADGLVASVNALQSNPQADRIKANMHWMVDQL